MMLTCLGRGQPATLPHGVAPPTFEAVRGSEERQDSLRATLERGPDCGAPLHSFLAHNRGNISRSLWRGVGDIKEALTPHSLYTLPAETCKFYLEHEEAEEVTEDDNFFEDITELYQRQKQLFQRSCDQIKDVYRVDIVNSTLRSNVSPFGEVSKIGGEALYLDVLYCLIHMIGCDKENFNQFELVEHLRKAFQIEPKRHLELYSEVESRAAPRVKLSLCFVEAKDLVPKNVSVTSNPYCTFYTSSTKARPQSTSCKSQTLFPVWNETYTMDVDIHSAAAEFLHIDVWNFDTGAGLVDKLKRVGEVRDGRGLKLLLSSPVTQAAGDKLIGHLDIDLRQLPACGENKWWKLYKVDGKQRKERGELHLIQHLFVREHQLQDHLKLLKVLLSTELVRRKVSAYSWRDNFSRETLQTLAQHAIQARMSRVDTALTRFFVYCEVHQVLPLDCRVFIPILEKLRKPVLANQIPDEMVKQFHETSETLVEHFTAFIRKHRLYIGNNPSKYLPQLEAILQCLHIIHTLKWRTRNDIVLQVEAALLASVREWFNFVMERIPTQEASQSGKMKNLTRITHLLMADIEEGKQQYQAMFWNHLNIDYIEIAYKEFDQNLTMITKSLIDKACDDMKPIYFEEVESQQPGIKSSLTVGTQLFELYLGLQQFYTLGFSVLKSEAKEGGGGPDFTVFHSWFLRAVAKWLDIALYKAMVRIVRSVRLDTLAPVDELSSHSSSAVDIRTVLTQIRTFWTQLSWPDVETSYVFISRIMDDVCKVVIFYAEKMCSKAEQQKSVGTRRRSVVHCSEEQCLAINNIDLVMGYMNPFVTDLGIDSVLNKLEQQKGGLVADACRKTIRTLMKNSVENVENQILTILEDVGAKMAPTIETFLFEGHHDQQRREASMADRRALLQYLDENLIFLKARLVPANFERVLSIMWAVSATSLSDIVHKSIEKKKSAQFFVSLYETFQVLLNFFYGDKIPQDSYLLTTKRLLELFASDSDSLVVSYYQQRLADQRSMQPSVFPLGSVTVKIQFLSSHLRIQILNCRHLKPVGELRRTPSNEYLSQRISRGHRLNKSSHNLSRPGGGEGDTKADFLRSAGASLRLSVTEARQLAHRAANQGMCSPYVTVKLVPGGPTSGPGPPHHAKARTLFPLFDETFDVVVPRELRPEASFLVFAVKDRGPLGDKLLLGEALVPLAEVRRCDQDCDLGAMAQIQLPLSKPGPKIVDILTAIETRKSSLSRESKKWLMQQQRKLLF